LWWGVVGGVWGVGGGGGGGGWGWFGGGGGGGGGGGVATVGCRVIRPEKKCSREALR